VPDMVVEASVYDLDTAHTAPLGCLCLIDNCLGQQEVVAVAHRFPESLPAPTQSSSACVSRSQFMIILSVLVKRF
jgi:hypothetical protein